MRRLPGPAGEMGLTVFAILYGVVYLYAWLVLFERVRRVLPAWLALVCSLLCVVGLHYILALVGHLCMVAHQRRRKQKEDSSK